MFCIQAVSQKPDMNKNIKYIFMKCMFLFFLLFWGWVGIDLLRSFPHLCVLGKPVCYFLNRVVIKVYYLLVLPCVQNLELGLINFIPAEHNKVNNGVYIS